MRHLTVVYSIPDGFDVSSITGHELASVMDWCHSIDEKNKAVKLLESERELSKGKLLERLKQRGYTEDDLEKSNHFNQSFATL